MSFWRRRIPNEVVATWADQLIDEIEVFLQENGSRCPARRFVNGKEFRCKHTVGVCKGGHFFIRVDRP